jgi:hypothetical protein
LEVLLSYQNRNEVQDEFLKQLAIREDAIRAVVAQLQAAVAEIEVISYHDLFTFDIACICGLSSNTPIDQASRGRRKM